MLGEVGFERLRDFLPLHQHVAQVERVRSTQSIHCRWIAGSGRSPFWSWSHSSYTCRSALACAVS